MEPTIQIVIQMGNAAFWTDDEELSPAEPARILRALANQIESGNVPEGDAVPLMDINGNACGHWIARR